MVEGGGGGVGGGCFLLVGVLRIVLYTPKAKHTPVYGHNFRPTLTDIEGHRPQLPGHSRARASHRVNP